MLCNACVFLCMPTRKRFDGLRAWLKMEVALKAEYGNTSVTQLRKNADQTSDKLDCPQIFQMPAFHLNGNNHTNPSWYLPRNTTNIQELLQPSC